MQQVQRVGFSQEQRQSQVLNTQMLQAVKLMEASAADLRDRIAEEIEKNPALELVKDKSLVSYESMFKPNVQGGRLHSRVGKQQIMEATVTHEETLQEHLLSAVSLSPITEEERSIAEFLIQNIDADGFNITQIEDLFKAPLNTAKNKYPQKALNRMIDFVRTLDPIGCCTNDYVESLTVQAKIQFADAENIIKLIPYMKELERGKFTNVLNLLKIPKDEIEILYEQLKTLSPFPGRQFKSGASSDARFVIPDIQVRRKKDNDYSKDDEDENEFSIILNDEEIPVLGIAPFFLRQTENIKKSETLKKDDKSFMEEKLKEARWFLECINKRNHTLLRVTRAILELQKDFFLCGPKYLSPLGLKDIAEKLKLSEATISRCANGKYVETEWGVFSLRYFFTNSISAYSNKGIASLTSEYSQSAVKEIIREIIANGEKHLPDTAIVLLLEKRGIYIARRTVAKYRKQLDIGSSYDR
ncbi:MAG: RNA polymerase factor sigma-54 [Termitinemataceae bacterium]|nr:MAG: RNA polymerase factor sigma-54 [Termitinemataceae bacterium]